jgi:hypothetical protein
MEVLILNQKLLVDFSCLFEVTAQVVQRGHAELIFNGAGESAVQIHNLVLVA